jgi:long-chain acyl-CoA synthetase
MTLHVRETLEGKRLLVTGVTGFLGKVFVAFLLDRVPDVGRITVLARGRKGQTAGARVQRIAERSPAWRPLREKYGDALGAMLAEKLEVVSGDAREPMLGITPADLERLAPRIDCVVHIAGLTDFVPDPADAVAVNVRGALHAADVAARTVGKNLVHVSTCFVAGKVDGPVSEVLGPGVSPNGTRFDAHGELVAIESLVAASRARHADIVAARKARIEAGQQRANALGWPNLYTYGKALAEHLLAARTDVRIALVRPSIVECARSFPFTGWNEGLNTSAPLVWLTGTLHRRMPFAPEHVFDVVPVDTVARGTTLVLASMLAQPGPTGVGERVFQLATGDHNPFTFARVLDLTTLARRRQYQKSEDSFERLVLAHMDSVISGGPAEADAFVPTARAVTKAARDALVSFDPDLHLPKGLRDRFGASLGKLAQRAGKSLGTASRTLGQVEEMLRLYQPFVYDHDPRLVTERVRTLSAQLDEDERADFGWDTDSLDWRDYWMNVQIPGLDRWSLPVLRGERVPEDEPQPLHVGVREIGDALPSSRDSMMPPAEAESMEASMEEGAE